jgi:MFS family permease
MLGVALPSVIYVISNAVGGEITPPARRGALLAIGTAIAGSAGLLAPYTMGRVIENATTTPASSCAGHHAGDRRYARKWDGCDEVRLIRTSNLRGWARMTAVGHGRRIRLGDWHV